MLAGGRGTRLYPYTVALPKPLVPVGDLPIAEILIRQLAHHGFDTITMAVNHQAELLAAYFGDGSKWGVSIRYSLEQQALGTMGPLAIIDDLPENFLVLNGDILCDLDFGKFHDEHAAAGRTFSISSASREVFVDFGVLQVDDSGYLERLDEKPTSHYQVSMGVYMVAKHVVGLVPRGKAYGFDDLMGDLIAGGHPVAVKPFMGTWLDIGRPTDYELASQIFAESPGRFLHG
jgi:NDP-sugar pyrophosphorylase family protein